MSDLYFTKSRLSSITFASDIAPRKIKKSINVKGFFRKGKFVRAFDRKQDVKEKVIKVAVASLAVLGTALGVGMASAASTKIRYNRNLYNIGKKMVSNVDEIADMKIPFTAKRYISPTRITDPNKKSMTFFSGGLDKVEEVSGEQLLVTVSGSLRKQKITKNHELIPLYHSYQRMKGGEDMMGMVKSIADVFETSAIKGMNPDSVVMAKEIYKWHKLNPKMPINIITHSAGGFQGRDIPHILDAAGVDRKLMKVFSTGSPDYGIVDDIVSTQRVMNLDDAYAKTIPNIKKGGGLPSLHRNTTFIDGALSPEFRKKALEKAKADALKEGKPFSELSEFEYRLAAHFSPGYYAGISPASKKTLETLSKFMFDG